MWILTNKYKKEKKNKKKKKEKKRAREKNTKSPSVYVLWHKTGGIKSKKY